MHDVIVLGSGLGGLSAAAACARRGLDTLLVEKEPRPGGMAVSYRRGGFPFDVALHVLPDAGPGGELRALFDELGLRGLAPVPLRRGTAVHIGAERVVLPPGWDGLFETLARMAPAESRGLARLRRRLEGSGRAFARLFDRRVPLRRALGPFLPRLPLFLRSSWEGTDRFLGRYVSDARVRALLFACALFFGLPPSRLPAVHFMVLCTLLHGGVPATLRGGGQALTDALARTFEQAGGRLLTSAAATALDTEGRRVRRVRLAGGEAVEARWFVSALSLPSLVDDLGLRRVLPRPYLAAVDALRPSLSVLQLHLGLDRPVRDLGFEHHLCASLPHADLEVLLAGREAPPLGAAFTLTAPGAETGDEGPEGRVLSLVTGADGPAWNRLGNGAYAAEKEKARAALLDALERIRPGTGRHVVEADLLTPRTLRRYTGAPGGAILGFEPAPGLYPTLRRAGRPPLSNLVLAGAWSGAGGGFLPCLRSGLAAADAVS